MVGFSYDEYDVDDDLESVSDCTREQVFGRDGRKCWLCEETVEKNLDIAHQIGAADEEAFSIFKDNGTLPVTDPSHSDNLFPLCTSCHRMYDAGGFPAWILVPDVTTLKKYIKHEKENYDYRSQLISVSPGSPTCTPDRDFKFSRTLPILDRSKILYHPLIISPSLPLDWFKHSQWPKVWLGEPTTVIHRVARRGLLESTPIQPISLGKAPGRGWQRGVPIMFQILIGQLIRLWARPTPVKGQE